MRRHFTATGFVVDGGRTLLHWHKRLRQWMPPGGHLEPDEDPVAAVLREVREESGLAAEVVPLARALPFAYPAQLPAPYCILVEDSPEPGEPHQHIDLIYFCRALGSGHDGRPPADPTLRWVAESDLRASRPLDVAGCGLSVPVPEDVRLLALVAIEAVRSAAGPES